MAEEAAGLLSPERNESIFRNDILRDYLPDGIGQAREPRLILLGGQPGAGKTAVLVASQEELSRTGPTIRIVGDDLRSYHPQFLAFQRQDPETASSYTQVDAGRWTEMLLAAGAERKVNIVFETTLRTPDNVSRVIRTARDAGYAVEIRAVAVNPRLSWQGNHYRFEEMLHAGAAARIPPQRVHDAAVDGLRITLEMLEAEKLVDRVQLRTRGGAIIYDNELIEGEWARTPAGRLVLEREQSRPMTRSELHRFADDWNHVLGRMEERGAPLDRIATVEARASDDMTRLLAQHREADGARAEGMRGATLENSADGHRLFVELYDNAVRDAERRPLGNVATHAAARLRQSYIALRLVEAARDLGVLPNDGTIVATRFLEQENRATHEFPAARGMPGDLVVETQDGARRRLTEYFGVALNQETIDRNVFSPTHRMSRLAVVVDSWLGAAGMRKTLRTAADNVAEGYVTVNEAMTLIVEPGYAAAVSRARSRLHRNISLVERATLARTNADTNGEPFRRAHDSLLRHTANPDNRTRVAALMDAALVESARYRHLDPMERQALDTFVKAITEDERRLGLTLDHGGRHRAAIGQTALVPARHLSELTEAEINERLRKSPGLASKRSEIEHLSQLVYANSEAASSCVRGISDAQSGLLAASDVHAGRLGEMAGHARTWLRGPSPDRQTAEAHAPRLAAALANYGQALDFERHQIVTQHSEVQARRRVEIPAPSNGLRELLAVDAREQVRRLDGEPALRRELDALALAISKRLSPSEKVDLRQGNVDRLATSLQISREQGAALRLVHERAKTLQDRVRQQTREISRGQQQNIRR